MAIKTIYTPEGEYELTREQATALWNRGITFAQVQQRIDEGWDFMDAILLSKNYYMYEGDICLRYSDNIRVLYIPLYVINRIRIDYNDTGRLFYNLSMGKSLRNAVSNMNNGLLDRKLSQELEAVDDTELVKDRQVARMRSKARANESKRLARAERAKQRDMERRPHMYDGTPQQHTRGKYTQHLMENNIFPKVVK